MKNPLTPILAAAALLAAGSAAAGEQPVRVKTDGLPTHMRLQVEAAAQQGPTALRHYLQRTRMIGYNLRLDEVVAESELGGTLAKSSPQPKARKVAAR
jgi:opacity protein-like surface antigen